MHKTTQTTQGPQTPEQQTQRTSEQHRQCNTSTNDHEQSAQWQMAGRPADNVISASQDREGVINDIDTVSAQRAAPFGEHPLFFAHPWASGASRRMTDRTRRSTASPSRSSMNSMRCVRTPHARPAVLPPPSCACVPIPILRRVCPLARLGIQAVRQGRRWQHRPC